MPALTTMLALGLGAAGTAVQVGQQKKAEKQARANANAQEIKALEAAKLKGPKMQDVKVKLGADGAATSDGTASTSSNTKGTATGDTGAAKRVGKVFAKSTSASTVGGL